MSEFTTKAAPQERRLKFNYVIHAKEDVGYTYIRKNACSTVKTMLLKTSRDGDKNPRRFREPAQFMAKYHRISAKRMAKLSRNIVVLREPTARVASGYVNQVLRRMENPSANMHSKIAELLGVDINSLTFADFVDRYLVLEESEINHHFKSQHSHLAPVTYSHVLSQGSLHEDAAVVFSKGTADKHFLKHFNSSAKSEQIDIEGASTLPLSELFSLYKEKGALPTKDSLLSDSVKEKIRSAFAADFALWDDYCRARSAAGDKPVPLIVTE